MFCPNCGRESNDDSKFCIYCGALYKHDTICKHCGKKNKEEANFCSDCGKPLNGAQDNKIKYIKIVCVACIAVVILFFAAILAILMTNSSNEEPQNTVVEETQADTSDDGDAPDNTSDDENGEDTQDDTADKSDDEDSQYNNTSQKTDDKESDSSDSNSGKSTSNFKKGFYLDGNILQTDFYTVTIPSAWGDDFDYEVNLKENDEYDVEFYHKESRAKGGGFVVGLALRIPNETNDYNSEFWKYDVLGLLGVKQAEAFDVIAYYPTDVEYDSSTEAGYTKLYNSKDSLVNSFKKGQYFTFKQY